MMTNSHLTDALDSVTKALIEALESKDEDQVVKLFELYNNIKAALPKGNGISIDFTSPAGASTWTDFGAASPVTFNDDVISFAGVGEVPYGDTIISGTTGEDTISLG
tara:strand:- start:851 stop:1171 length:321 start_codon:yes stop_codon:yes gene_type:complete